MLWGTYPISVAINVAHILWTNGARTRAVWTFPQYWQVEPLVLPMTANELTECHFHVEKWCEDARSSSSP